MNLRVVAAIARDEWRYWRRSKLGMISSAAVLLLTAASLLSTVTRVETERITRDNFQVEAEETFASQPARHPHRMIHYGHYVFRVPPPLSVIDPGVDAFTGTVMFLEGHRQNAAVFSPRYSAAQAGPLAELSPAFAYQILVPLLLIVLGFGSIPREREAKTDYLLYAGSVTATDLWLGKTLALAGAALLSLAPLVLGLVVAWGAGASLTTAAYLFIGYAIYLLTWVFLISALSAVVATAAASFSMLLACWVALCVVVPPIAGAVAVGSAPVDGKVASDYALGRALRSTGDGHNAADPAFAGLRAQLLEQYEVSDVADLPINIRGVVAQVAESKQGEILNTFADERMFKESAQSQVVGWFGLLSPALALKNFSVITAGTDLRQYHRFLRDAEAVRYDFVQKLNALHIEQLAYSDDIQRSNDPEAEQRTRLNAANWRMLEEVSSLPRPASTRLLEGFPHLLIMLAWCAFMAWVGVRNMKKGVNDVE